MGIYVQKNICIILICVILIIVTQSQSQLVRTGVVYCFLPFSWENRKFRIKNQMVCPIPFWKLQKIWAVIWGDAVFLLFLVCSAYLEILCRGSLSHHVKFKSFMFMHKVFVWMVSTRTFRLIPLNFENKPRGLYFSKALFEGLMYGGKFAFKNRLG